MNRWVRLDWAYSKYRFAVFWSYYRLFEQAWVIFGDDLFILPVLAFDKSIVTWAYPLTEDKGFWLFALGCIGQGIAVDDVLFKDCLDAAADRVPGFFLVHASVVIVEDAEETIAAVFYVVLHDVYAIYTLYCNERVYFKLGLGFFVTRFYNGKFAFKDRCEEVAITTSRFEES